MPLRAVAVAAGLHARRSSAGQWSMDENSHRRRLLVVVYARLLATRRELERQVMAHSLMQQLLARDTHRSSRTNGVRETRVGLQRWQRQRIFAAQCTFNAACHRRLAVPRMRGAMRALSRSRALTGVAAKLTNTRRAARLVPCGFTIHGGQVVSNTAVAGRSQRYSMRHICCARSCPDRNCIVPRCDRLELGCRAIPDPPHAVVCATTRLRGAAASHWIADARTLARASSYVQRAHDPKRRSVYTAPLAAIAVRTRRR